MIFWVFFGFSSDFFQIFGGFFEVFRFFEVFAGVFFFFFFFFFKFYSKKKKKKKNVV
jgi:hypothetical protein